MFARSLILPALLALAASACAPAPQATAELKDPRGASVGRVTFAPDGGGLKLVVEVSNLPTGRHGIHIHAAGKCEGPDFASAGAHFNPDNKKHGVHNPDGPHNGDLPNLDVGGDGKGKLEFLSTRVSFTTGAPNSLFKEGGTAVVIHASPDDESTDPTGNSGARIACGVITKSGS